MIHIQKGQKEMDKPVTIKELIAERFSQADADAYIPYGNCFDYQGWKQRGYTVKRGQKALQLVTIVDGKKIISSVFYIKQVVKVK